MEEIPLADKNIESKNTEERRPPLGLFLISSKISEKKILGLRGKKKLYIIQESLIKIINFNKWYHIYKGVPGLK